MTSSPRSLRRVIRGIAPLAITAMFSVPLAPLVACSSSGSGDTTPTGCTKDSDCKGDRVCSKGECVDAGTTTSSGGGAGAGTTASGATTTATGAGGGATTTASTGTGGATTTASTGTGGGDPPAASCKALLTAKPGTPDGVYPIDPDGAGSQPATELFCDMTNGGLTLVANIFDSTGDDAPNATDFVVSGWQQKGNGQWDTKATKVARDATGSGSAAVSLAFVAALKASAGQMHLKMCFVSNAGSDTECRNSATGSMTLVSYPTGNPKLTGYASDTLAYTYRRLAGLAGTADGYDSTKFTEAGAPITKTPGVDNDELFGGGDTLIDKNAKANCPAYDGVWHASGAGQSYKPWEINAQELSAGLKDCQVSTADPTPLGYGFRLYVGP